MNQQFEQCLKLAQAIVQQYRAEAPEGFDVLGFNVGGSTTEGDSRQKTNMTTTTEHKLPDWLNQIMASFGKSLTPASDAQAKNTNFLEGLLSGNTVGGQYTDKALNDINPTQFTGRDSLTAQANVNPFSGDYESSTEAAYQNRVAQALSSLRSGPGAVRGGTARTAIAEGQAANQMALNRADEIRKQQQADATMAQNAANVLNTIEGGRRATLLAGQKQLADQSLTASGQMNANQNSNAALLGMLAQWLGQNVATQAGTGKSASTQGTDQWGVGFNCCFIFLEAYHGKLPKCVRRGRDGYYRVNRDIATGYRRTAQWLVPMMQKNQLVRWFVWTFMVNPITIHLQHPKKNWRKRVCHFWLKTWAWLGKGRKESDYQMLWVYPNYRKA